jgi:hypothetical protein
MLKDLAESYPNMTVLMGQIVDARISGQTIWEYSADDAFKKADEYVAILSAICGARLPQSTFFADTLAREFLIFLTDFGYSEYSFEEILLAFRINAKGANKYPSGIEVEPIEYKGAHFNIEYAAKVLDNYSKFRNLLDRKFQNHIDGYDE